MGKKRIAVVGGGISGLVSAYLLRDVADVVLYEADERLGGHANTVDTDVRGQTVPVDTAVVVFNTRTYPLFVKLLAHLDVTPVETDMGLSVRDDERRVEYSSHYPLSFLSLWRKIFTPLPYQLMRDIPRFRKASRLHANDPSLTVGDILDRYGLGEAIVDHMVLPLTATVWSIDFARCREMPFGAWLEFVNNHGLATPRDLPTWYAFKRGTREYINKLGAALGERARLSSPVSCIERKDDGVWVTAAGSEPERYDEVVIAIHTDIAAKVLKGGTEAEMQALSDITFQPNDSALHSDASVMPRFKKAWTQWNYHMRDRGYRAATVTYNMNALQVLDLPDPLLVSMNQTELLDPALVRERFEYRHVRYNVTSLAARDRLPELSGKDRIHFAGCYLGMGFHEDGIRSAVQIAEKFGVDKPFG